MNEKTKWESLMINLASSKGFLKDWHFVFGAIGLYGNDVEAMKNTSSSFSPDSSCSHCVRSTLRQRGLKNLSTPMLRELFKIPATPVSARHGCEILIGFGQLTLGNLTIFYDREYRLTI
ncbi:hypothetical protein H5410_008753 [Solanum commersonii]|uniref:Uncharacterized protein n=1 Tax=Solanum commersonii TaxID=4109 RepID=A0A9J6AHN3_SOLCO|nr:hypothetical protein H5410_008753 [Solanum commersonii]